MNSSLRIILFLLTPLIAHAASLQVTMSSQFLARGEQAIVEVQLEEIEPPETLRMPSIPGVSIQARGFGGPSSIMLPGRKYGYVYQFVLTTFEPGKHKIPAISLRVGSQTYDSEPVEFEVFDANQISFSELRIGTDTIPYAAFFRAAKTEPYAGEIVPVEMKIYFPANIRIEEWGIPDFDRSNVTAWRFEPRPQLGSAIMLGTNYQCVSYPSTMAAIKDGPFSIGPAKIRLISVQNVIGQFGFEQNAIPLNIEAAAIKLNARALPPGAPEGFVNAVGSFTLDATIDQNEVREGDPLNIDLRISGRGNIDSIAPPVLSDPEGWKLYDATRSEMGEERRQLRGTVTFKQFMRPTARQTMVPPFRMVYFDPDAAAYKILSSSPIPLKVLPSTNSGTVTGAIAPIPMAADLPVEKMTDILGVIQGAALLRDASATPLPYLWHLAPLIIVLTLAFSIFYRHYWPRWQATPEQKERRSAWKTLEQAPEDQASFLRQAGRFIEVWLPRSADDEQLREILRERDESCFLPSSSTTPLPRARRQEILRILRKAAFCLAAMLLIGGTHLQAEETPAAAADAATAYQQGKYKDAVAAWLASGPYEQLSAATLYNIGNACYRAGSQGHAALYYRRALMADPTLEEARQNLRFLERKFGALTIKRPNYQFALTRVPESWFRNLLYGSVWCIAISVLIFPATARGSRLRIAALAGLLVCPILAIGSALAQYYYPDDSMFAPYSEQAVVIADKTTVFSDASRTSGQVIEVPAGSLCRIIRRSDRWVYIAFASQTRGWVPDDRIDTLVPTTPPQVPDFSPPKEKKGSSA
jgi:tetratricopeptide (TPR) repeat protein